MPGSAADAARHRRLLAELDAADPAGVARLLAGLDRPTLRALARRDPALVGRFDGAPAYVRDHADRVLLDAEVRRVSDGVLTTRLGGDPTRGGFGAATFEVGDAGGHDLAGYLDPSPGTVSGTNFGYLVTGRFDQLEATP